MCRDARPHTCTRQRLHHPVPALLHLPKHVQMGRSSQARRLIRGVCHVLRSPHVDLDGRLHVLSDDDCIVAHNVLKEARRVLLRVDRNIWLDRSLNPFRFIFKNGHRVSIKALRHANSLVHIEHLLVVQQSLLRHQLLEWRCLAKARVDVRHIDLVYCRVVTTALHVARVI